jgi:hypothetical protein
LVVLYATKAINAVSAHLYGTKKCSCLYDIKNCIDDGPLKRWFSLYVKKFCPQIIASAVDSITRLR